MADMGAATFRAVREMCGLRQADVADELGVRLSTVKRWERGVVPLPEDARVWMTGMRLFHESQVEGMVGDIMADVDYGAIDGVCVLEYYRTQDEYEAATGDTMRYEVADAYIRAAAEHVAALGVRVEFAYPDGEPADER